MKHVVASTLSLAVAAAFFLVPLAHGQSTNDPGIQQRMQNQDRRIDQGINSGQLTPKEAGRLETEQAKIKQDELRAKSDGNLTQKERTKLTKEQNRASKDIHRLKHNNRHTGTN
ncbi:MAG TPA: hypothetical protein VMT71_00415 [Syntrophorhabdales bacterium]|nr:hypothetical protein [Syntrophorhabdales bacterium]